MDLIFNNQTYSYDYTPTNLQLIERSKELLEDKYYFEYFVLNRTEKIENPEELLSRNLKDETVLELIATEAAEFVRNLLESTYNYIENANPNIEILVDKFYSHPSPNEWKDLSDLFEGIDWIFSMVNVIENSKFHPSNWSEVVKDISNFESELSNLEEALENTDSVLIADILKYEALPVFQTIKEQVELALKNYGGADDFN